MERTIIKYSRIPTEKDLLTLKWFIVWDPRKKLHHVINFCEDISCVFWTPLQNSYSKTPNNIRIKPELLFPTYYFVGVPDAHNLYRIDGILSEVQSHVLGMPRNSLSGAELLAISKISSKYGEVPKLNYKVKKGDIVEVSSGPFTGFSGKVEEVNKDAITLKIFFLGNHVNVTLSVLDTDVGDKPTIFNEYD